MLCTRREMVEMITAAGASLMLQDGPPMGAKVRTPVNPPEPAEKREKEEPENQMRRVSLQALEKELRETLEQLFVKVSELRTGLQRASSAQVFSVAVFKQTQEIEKLAKKLRNDAKR